MAISRLQNLACFVLAITFMAAFSLRSEAAVTCETVYSTLMPCLPYVIGGGDEVPEDCCAGVKSVYDSAKAKTDRQAVCVCLKKAADKAGGIDISRASDIPEKCGVNLGYKISPDMDCSKVP